MSRKEIEFVAKLDTSEIDKAFARIKRESAQMSAGTGAATGNSGSGSSSGQTYGMSEQALLAFRRNEQNQKSVILRGVQEQTKAQEGIAKQIRLQTDYLEKTIKYQKTIIEDEKELLRVKKEIADLEKSLQRDRETFEKNQAKIDRDVYEAEKAGKSPDRLERLVAGYKGGGIGGVASEGMAQFSAMGLMGQIGLVAGAILASGKAVSMIREGITTYTRIPLEANKAIGSAVSNMYGRQLSAIYGGGAMTELAFAKPTKEAAELAKKDEDRQRKLDEAMSIGGILKSGLPIDAKLAGAGLSAVTGMFFNERINAKNLSQLPSWLGGNNFKQQYESMSASSQAKIQEEQRQALLAKDPMLKASAENLQQRQAGDLQFQRQMGLNYETFHGKGGFREQSIGAGFQDTQAMEAASRIMAAGGSTRGSTGNAILGLQAERTMDMTNAPELLGKISGVQGSPEATRQTFIKMLAEGNRLGLDSSQFREENRKFQEFQADVISRSGTRSQSDIEDAIRRVGAFASGATTTKDISAARSAYEQYKQDTSATSGPHGVLRAAAMYNDPIIGGMSGFDQAKLAGMDTDTLTTDHPVIKDAVENYNKGKAPKDQITASQLVERMRAAGEKAQYRLPDTDKKKERVAGLKKQLSSKMLTPEYRKNLEDQLEKAEVAYQSNEAGETQNYDPQFLRQMSAATTDPDAKNRAIALQKAKEMETKLGGKETGRQEDQYQQGLAAASKLVLENFRELHTVLVRAPKDVSDFTDALNASLQKLRGLSGKEYNDFLRTDPMLRAIMAVPQPQAGAPAPTPNGQ